MVFATHQQCYSCERKYGPQETLFECPKCFGPLHFHYNAKEIRRALIPEEFQRQEAHHWKYWPFYPITDLSSIVTMHEGGTPLLKSGREKGLYFKFEGTNPTGSFKDRGSSLEITRARQLGVREVACASTGNMGASIAAYGTRAGLRVKIYAPLFAPKEKLQQIKAHNAKVETVIGSYDKCFQKVRQLWKKENAYLTGDYVYRAEGSKSVGMEIVDQLRFQAPAYVVCPVGMGNLIAGVYKGLNEFKQAGLVDKLPKIVGVQATGCNPVVQAFEDGVKKVKERKSTKTVAEAINCGNPNYGQAALDAVLDTNGVAVSVNDKEIMNARLELGKEGVYAEPAAAASLAGARKLGLGGGDEKVVCVVTGHGLKDSFPKA